MKFALMFYVFLSLWIPLCSSVAQVGGTLPIDLTRSNFSPLVVNDAVWGQTNCVVTHSSLTVTCTVPYTYVVQTTPYTSILIADDAGPLRAPYIANIFSTSYNASSKLLTITLLAGSTPPAFDNSGVTHVAYFDVPTGQGGAGYKFGSVQTLNCVSPCATGDGHVDATGSPAVMAQTGTAMVPTASGSGGISGCTTPLTPASQIGLAGNTTLFSGSISGGKFTFSSISATGLVTGDNPANYVMSSGQYTDTLVGCGYTASTGPQATFSYTISAEQINPGSGIYNQAPPCTISAGKGTTSTGDNGSGLMLDCSSAPLVNPNQTFKGTVSYGTDNTLAFQTAIGPVSGPPMGTMNYASAHGQPECFYLPAGNYLTRPTNNSGNHNSYVMEGYGCWLGDEHFHSNIFVIPNSGGGVFTWSDASQNGSIVDLTNTQTFSNLNALSMTNPEGTSNQGGSSFRNLTITGDRLSTANQNALVFYGKTTFANIDNVVISFMKGRGIWAGVADYVSSLGDFNESIIQNVRFEIDGNNTPTIEITSAGSTEASNTDTLSNIRIYEPLGTGLWIHNTSATINNARDLRLSNIFIEGSLVSNTTLGGDLIEIGDPALGHPNAGTNVSEVLGRNIQLVNPILNYAAIHVAGDAGADTAGIDIEGSIVGALSNPGRGLQVEACQQCSFKFAENSSYDYNLLIGRAAANTACSNSLLRVCPVTS